MAFSDRNELCQRDQLEYDKLRKMMMLHIIGGKNLYCIECDDEDHTQMHNHIFKFDELIQLRKQCRHLYCIQETGMCFDCLLGNTERMRIDKEFLMYLKFI